MVTRQLNERYRVGDIIVAVDGAQVEVSADLPHIVGLLAPGDVVDITIIRDGEETLLEVEIGALEADEIARVVTAPSEPGTVSVLGMTVKELEESDEPGPQSAVVWLLAQSSQGHPPLRVV